MKSFIVYPLAFFAIIFSLTAQKHSFDPEVFRAHIEFLASDSLKGRYPGTPEDFVAASYIRDRFADAGLELLYENGMQPFEVVTSVSPHAESISLNYAGTNATYSDHFGLYAFSSSTTVESTLVFAGFGLVIDTDDLKHNDYENLDVKDKWVIVLKGDPEPDNNNSPYLQFANARSKALFARDQGAAGIILIGGSKNMPEDEPAPFTAERTVRNVGLPVIDVRKNWADEHIFNNSYPVDSLESWIIHNKPFNELEISGILTATTKLVFNQVTTYNVVGKLKGSHPTLSEEYVVFGAHYDHLGMGGRGSGSRRPDTLVIHYGADDNASGVAGVIEMANYFTTAQTPPERSLLFVAFGAEEMGLIGSRYFVDNPPVQVQNMVAMINFDMIGRLSERKSVSVSGTGTAVETEGVLDRLSENSELSLSYSPQGFGASDHASFYAKDVPVMFFTTGAHPDYHTHNDTPDRINYQGMVEVMDLAALVASELVSMPEKLSFQEAGPRERERSGRGFRVTLGIMPDFTTSAGNGLPVGGVTKDGPADKAGMLRGDVIVAINGMAVESIYDYMNRLNQLRRGETANVDVVREGEIVVLVVDL